MKLSSALPDPKDARQPNGLSAYAADMMRDPHKPLVAIVVLDTAKITDDIDKDERYPTAQIRSIEVVTDDTDKATLRRIAEKAHEKRTGVTALPIGF